jgi:hypothetical protein
MGNMPGARLRPRPLPERRGRQSARMRRLQPSVSCRMPYCSSFL